MLTLVDEPRLDLKQPAQRRLLRPLEPLLAQQAGRDVAAVADDMDDQRTRIEPLELRQMLDAPRGPVGPRVLSRALGLGVEQRIDERSPDRESLPCSFGFAQPVEE